MDRSQKPNPGLVLDGVEDFVDGDYKWSELLYRLVVQSRLGERIGSAYSSRQVTPGSNLGMGESFVRRLGFSSIFTMLSRVINESPHCLLQLDVGLSSG